MEGFAILCGAGDAFLLKVVCFTIIIIQAVV